LAQQAERFCEEQRKFEFSVILATRNRAAILMDVLSALCEQIRAEVDVELVIIDNASTDNTKAAVELFIRSCPIPEQVRYLYEDRVGLSAARNAGARLARGRYLIFLDDDVYLERDWLASYRKVSANPNLRVAGGSIEPLAEPNADFRFVGSRYLWIYGRLDFGSTTRPLASKETLNGGNILFEKSTFLALGGLDESFGHKGENMGGAEEQELLARIRQHYPTSCYYAGAAKVYHRVAPQRATLEYALSRIRLGSQAIARSELRHRPRTVVVLKSIYYYFNTLFLPLFPGNELRRAECSGYLEGLWRS